MAVLVLAYFERTNYSNFYVKKIPRALLLTNEFNFNTIIIAFATATTAAVAPPRQGRRFPANFPEKKT